MNEHRKVSFIYGDVFQRMDELYRDVDKHILEISAIVYLIDEKAELFRVLKHKYKSCNMHNTIPLTKFHEYL